MPIRFNVGGVQFEVDTAAEARDVQREFSQDKRQAVSRPLPFATKPKSPTRAIFKNGQYPAFLSLWAADDGLQTETLVQLLGLDGPKSLPPIIAAWSKRAASIGLNLREMLEVDRGFANGKPETIYRLTAKGREVLQPEESETAEAATQ